jgi:hypothetical protein
MTHEPENGGNKSGDDAEAEHPLGPYDEGGDPRYHFFDEDGTLLPEADLEGFDAHLREEVPNHSGTHPPEDSNPSDHPPHPDA